MIRRSTLCLLLLAAAAAGQSGGQLRFCLRAEPKTFNPLLVDDQYSETIRYLTGGVLIRTPVNSIREMSRSTQGVTLINLSDGEKLAGIERVVESDDEDGE